MNDTHPRFLNNADHPREHHIMVLLDEMLSNARFPLTRIRLSVEFSPILSDFAAHKLNIELVNGKPHGGVRLAYNSLFLMQDPLTFYRDIVPHQVAHVLTDIVAIKQGVKVLEHGPEWQDWLALLSVSATPASSFPDAGFDDRAIKLHRGGVLCRCACQGVEAYKVVSNTGPQIAKLKQGDTRCKVCKEAYMIRDVSETPPKIKQEIEFIRDEICKRPSLDQVQQE